MWLNNIDSKVLSGIGTALKVIYARIGLQAAPDSHNSQRRLLVITNVNCFTSITLSEPSLVLH